MAADEAVAQLRTAQARLLAEQSQGASRRGDHGTAFALALEGLALEPRSIEAERAFNEAKARLRELHVFSGHDYRVGGAAFTPDGAQLVTGDHSGVVRIWDVASGERVRRFKTETSQMEVLSLSPDGKRMLIGGWGGAVQLIDLQDGRAIYEFKDDAVSVKIALFSPDGRYVLTHGYARPVRIWDAETGEARGAFSKHLEDKRARARVSAVSIAPDSRRVIVGDTASDAWIWSIDVPDQAVRLEQHEKDVDSVAFGPDGRVALTLVDDQSMRAWDAESGDPLWTARGQLQSATFSPDGAFILTAGVDDLHGGPNALGLWSAQTGTLEARLGTGEERAQAARYSADGKRIFARVGAREIWVWNAETLEKIAVVSVQVEDLMRAWLVSPDGQHIVTTGEYRHTRVAPDAATARLWSAVGAPWLDSVELAAPTDAPSRFSRRVSGVALRPDGAGAALWSSDGKIWLWEFEGGLTQILEEVDDKIVSAVFSADGATLLVGGEHSSAWLWDVSAGAVRSSWSADRYAPTQVVFGADGSPLAIELDEAAEQLLLRNIATDTELARLAAVDIQPELFALSPDGRFLVGSTRSDYGGATHIWDLEKGVAVSAEMSGEVSETLGLRFSPDGGRLLTVSDGEVHMYAPSTGAKIVARGWFSPHSRFSSASFSPDGSRIATAGPDAAVWIRDGATAEVVQVIRENGHPVSAYFSPDGQLLVVGTWWRDARVFARQPFDGEEWREVMTLDVGGRIDGVLFTPDGRRLLSWGQDKARLWAAPVRGETALESGRQAAPRCLSVDERRRYFLDPEPPRWCIAGPGREQETDPQNWRPKHPYRTRAWVQWLVAKDRGEVAAMPSKPTDD